MTTLVLLLVLLQALGACIGVVNAVRGELAYVRAMKDKRIDEAEDAHLRHIARGLRVGMLVLLLSSFGLIILSYLRHTPLQPALQSSYWALIVLSLLIIIVSWALSRKHLSFPFGSAVIFSGWWFLLYLAMGQLPGLSFGAAVGFFAVVTALFYAILSGVRMRATR